MVSWHVLVELGGEGIALIADVEDDHLQRPFRQGQAEKAVAVGRGPLLQSRFVQDSTDQLLTAGSIFDVAAERMHWISLRPDATGETDEGEQKILANSV